MDLASIVLSDVSDWLEGVGQRAEVMFLGGSGGALVLELGNWYSKLENCRKCIIINYSVTVESIL